MDKTEDNDESFGIEVIVPDGDKTTPCCPHGKSKCTGQS